MLVQLMLGVVVEVAIRIIVSQWLLPVRIGACSIARCGLRKRRWRGRVVTVVAEEVMLIVGIHGDAFDS